MALSDQLDHDSAQDLGQDLDQDLDQDLQETDDRVSPIHRWVAEMAPAKGRVVTSQTRLVEDCGYDSVAILELVLTLESELGLAATIGIEHSVDLVTVADLEDLVARVTAPKQ